ncbi:Glycoside hydrolase, family 19, catalytic [uncultured Caudovirales phage]|uniref:Glycoside hydrolase, family 19, catalytic n=1 Tax=uncultured Caudovirales phage TaxID=2100421 RepID=A0A6J5L7X8_9CAUD|nr:Glycoside hydrolase, family 19, catalytic [uncultured Caudovirales phage]
MVNSDQLARLGIGPQWVDPLNETFAKFGINTLKQRAAFIGQCSHECGNFRILEENLNYKAATLMRLWPRRFPTLEIANAYAGNPKKIANSVYANRMGNRDESSGDGYRFRGRGCIQTTGHANYFHAGKALGVDFVMKPDLVATPQYAALTAGFYWSTHNLNALAEAGDDVACCKRINGGTIGLDDRIAHTRQALAVLA